MKVFVATKVTQICKVYSDSYALFYLYALSPIWIMYDNVALLYMHSNILYAKSIFNLTNLHSHIAWQTCKCTYFCCQFTPPLFASWWSLFKKITCKTSSIKPHQGSELVRVNSDRVLLRGTLAIAVGCREGKPRVFGKGEVLYCQTSHQAKTIFQESGLNGI